MSAGGENAMKRWSILFVAAFMMWADPAMAQPVQTYDFSDVMQPFMTLPFNVLRIETTGEYNFTKHIYHLSDDFDVVVRKLNAMFEKGEKLSGFIPMGMTRQLDGSYQIMFGYRNEHHFAMVRPESTGCLIEVEAFPSSMLSGVYDISIYGYTMPDDSTISADQFFDE